MSQRNWLIGYRIAEEELAGEERAEYGVLIDLKTERITHQDVGQMDMYIRMYDELKKFPDDNLQSSLRRRTEYTDIWWICSSHRSSGNTVKNAL